MHITNLTRKSHLATHVKIADTFLSRMVGLLNRSQINQDEALIITRCNSIHMFFMRFAIDAIFIDRNKRIVGLVKNIKPFALSKIYWNAACVIELAVGAIERNQAQLGDQLDFN